MTAGSLSFKIQLSSLGLSPLLWQFGEICFILFGLVGFSMSSAPVCSVDI